MVHVHDVCLSTDERYAVGEPQQRPTLNQTQNQNKSLAQTLMSKAKRLSQEMFHHLMPGTSSANSTLSISPITVESQPYGCAVPGDDVTALGGDRQQSPSPEVVYAATAAAVASSRSSSRHSQLSLAPYPQSNDAEQLMTSDEDDAPLAAQAAAGREGGVKQVRGQRAQKGNASRGRGRGRPAGARKNVAVTAAAAAKAGSVQSQAEQDEFYSQLRATLPAVNQTRQAAVNAPPSSVGDAAVGGKQVETTRCPICNQEFLGDNIHTHAANCGSNTASTAKRSDQLAF